MSAGFHLSSLYRTIVSIVVYYRNKQISFSGHTMNDEKYHLCYLTVIDKCELVGLA